MSAAAELCRALHGAAARRRRPHRASPASHPPLAKITRQRQHVRRGDGGQSSGASPRARVHARSFSFVCARAPARSRVRLVVCFFFGPALSVIAELCRAAPHVRVGRVVACECVGVQAVDRWVTCAGRRPTSSIGHNYISHNYIGHNYIGHNYIGHTYTGHNYAQAGVRRPLAPTQPCACKHPRTLNRCTGDITAWGT